MRSIPRLALPALAFVVLVSLGVARAQAGCDSSGNMVPNCAFDSGIEGWIEEEGFGELSWRGDDGADAPGCLEIASLPAGLTGNLETVFCIPVASEPPSVEWGFSYRQIGPDLSENCSVNVTWFANATCTEHVALGGSLLLDEIGVWAASPSAVTIRPAGANHLLLNLYCSNPLGSDYRFRIDDVYARAGLDEVLCQPDETTLCINDQPGDGRFRIRMSYETASGGGLSGDAKALNLDAVAVRRGGLLYFLNSGNPEVLIKILNGCLINDHFWVFYAATTTVGFELTVEDLATGAVRSWSNTDGFDAVPVSDIEAFSCE